MNSSTRPLLLIDVDGVLNPFRARGLPPGYVAHELAGYRVLLSRKRGADLLALADRYDLVWATTWEHQANTLIAPNCGLPQLPVIEFPKTREHDGYTWKLPAVRRYIGNRPTVWIDDDLGSDALRWADERQEPTLLVEPDPAIGITTAHLKSIARFAARLAEGDGGGRRG